MTVQTLDELFERRATFPEIDAQDRLSRLVGLDDQKARLSKVLGLLVNPDSLNRWSKKYHPAAASMMSHMLRRPPLVILAGDVGSGKTELAETIGDMVARQERLDVTLYPLSLSTRGQGRVGEMTQLITAAFTHTVDAATKLKNSSGVARGGIILLVDEADALAQSREAAQMHHEDRAGVNAFIRGIDRLGNGQLPAAVIMCTNRLDALDPAVKRRAADILSFTRPSAEQRLAVLAPSFSVLGLNSTEIDAIVKATGPRGSDQPYGFTFSDLTQRAIPNAVLDAYPNGAVTAAQALEVISKITPTPPFQSEA